tara:strand:- start:935 stop:1117 length:183 start_codon:yes stop_codon:yes gene_type:complete
MEYEKTIDGSHQFRVPSADGNTLAMRVTSEGIIIDLEDPTGEVIKSAYQLWSDLEDLTGG